MKYASANVMALGILALGLAACSPQSLKTQWDWRGFAGDPSEAHFRTLTGDLAGCQKPGCETLANITDADIDALSARIDADHPYAVRFGFRAYPLLFKALPATRLARRYGDLISRNPRAFLMAAKAENGGDFALATTTSADVLNDPSGQEVELDRRRWALLTVTEPGLLALRDAYVAEIGKAWDRADEGILYVRPVAVADRPPPLPCPQTGCWRSTTG